MTLSAAMALAGARGHAEETVPVYRVIENEQNPVHEAPLDFVSKAFLKKTTRWDDGELIRPVDLPADARTRQRFSEHVLKRTVAAVRNYWQQRIFSGRGIPPPELDSEDAVVRYVRAHRGALGYVSGDARLENVRAIAVR